MDTTAAGQAGGSARPRTTDREVDVPTATDGALADGGSMGALMRTHDWSGTTLGPVAEWPQSLKTAASICLASRFPMLIWWGRELVMLYNDAYRPMLGATKHPAALGQRGRECWPEIWDIIGPMLDGVLTRGEATWSADQMLPLDRNGYVEECYFTFSYSPIRVEEGAVGGVFTAVTETTERVLGERRLATLRALAERAATAAESVRDACEGAAAVLAQDPSDMPFALLYLFDDERGSAELAAAAGVPPGTPASPERLPIEAAPAASAWPLAAVAGGAGEEVVPDLGQRFGALPGGPWPEPSHTAIVLPIASQGQARPLGALVAGISPRRALDDAYRSFLRLVAGHVATAVANALTYEAERARAEALAALDRAKTAFFSNVSHEFRTPLTLLLGPMEEAMAEARAHGERFTPAQRERIEIVHRNALRMLRLVNALLDFSRIEAGRARATYRPANLATLTAELASGFQSVVERAGMRLVVACEPLPEPVYVDRDMWEQIVLNLLSNAFKHTFEGEITVRLRAVPDGARLEVADTGIGIAAAELPRIFDRFHRVPNARSRTHEGTGIGLALVQELVRLHGGSISAASEVGHGTTFTVTVPFGARHLPPDQVHGAEAIAPRAQLPLFAAEALRWLPDEPAADARGDVAADDAPLGRVLVADDNADMRAYIARLLRGAGWEVEVVPDGRSALDAARRRTPDIVLTDVMMPGLDGAALLRALRDDPATARVPVIMLSARAGEEARTEGLDWGADDYLVKPFTARELTSRLAAHVALSRVRERSLHDAAVASARLSSILMQAPVAIAVLRGPDHVFELANPPYVRLIGGREVVGRAVRDAIPEVEGQGVIELLDRVRATGEPYVASEFPLAIDIDGDGAPEERFFNWVYQPLVNDAGEVEGTAVVVVDVTDLVSSRKRADEARHEAESANRAKSEFLATMSHELRTPLNAIAGYTELMLLGVPDQVTPAQRDYLRRVQQSQRHLLGLINSVLNFAKLEAGRVDYMFENVPVRELISAVDVLVSPQLATKGLRFVRGECPRALVVRVDREKAIQVLLNLLSNAIKFTARGGEVRIEVEASASGVSIHVRDTGIGIAADKLQAIFDPFVQIDPRLARTHEGTGLGLAISRELAKGMQGDLTVVSRPGVGSTFTLVLPIGGA